MNSISEMAIHNEAIRTKLSRVEDTLKMCFITNLHKAKQDGTINPKFDSETIANQLHISLNGLLLASKVIKDDHQMVEACLQFLEFILAGGNKTSTDLAKLVQSMSV